MQNATPTNFCVGVAGYPEKHFEAPNIETDIINLKKKIEAGAEYIVTQLFYDNKKYFEFVDLCRKHDINVPIIPGIKPLTKRNQLNSISKFFHVSLPYDFSKEIDRCKNDDDVMKVGLEWSVNQCKELLEQNVSCLHFYTLGKSKAAQMICEDLF